MYTNRYTHLILSMALALMAFNVQSKVTGEEIYNKTLESTQIYDDKTLQEYKKQA